MEGLPEWPECWRDSHLESALMVVEQRWMAVEVVEEWLRAAVEPGVLQDGFVVERLLKTLISAWEFLKYKRTERRKKNSRVPYLGAPFPPGGPPGGTGDGAPCGAPGGILCGGMAPGGGGPPGYPGYGPRGPPGGPCP